MRFTEKLVDKFKKPYDKYHYDMADAPGDMQRANEELKRIATERKRIILARNLLNIEHTDDNDTFSDDWELIGRDTKVVGGDRVFAPRDGSLPLIRVDCGYSIDSDATPDIVKEYSNEVTHRMIPKRRGISRESAIPNHRYLARAVYDTVRDRMKLKKGRVSRKGFTVAEDLSPYMERGGYVEGNHLVLACAALLDVRTPGVSVSVETGTRFNQDDITDFELHSWVRYTDRARVVWILDPIKGFCGELAKSEGKSDWEDYCRPEEKGYVKYHKNTLTQQDLAIISLEAFRKDQERARNPDVD